MKRDLLNRLLLARKEKKPAVHLRWTDLGEEGLVIGDPAEASLDPSVVEVIENALRLDLGITIDTARGKLFVQPFNPPLRLIVVGAVHIAQALVPMASLAGYEAVVVDPRRAFASDRRFPDVSVSQDWPDEALEALSIDARTAVVTLTHDPKLDDPALDVALRSPAFYIASLGSRRTHAARRERLSALGHGEDAFSRIHGPAGLDVGAVSPAEIAISVMAEMTGVLRGKASA